MDHKQSNKVDCSNVYIAPSLINTEFDGAYAKKNFAIGDIVEYGIARIINIDGYQNPYVFTWSDTIPNTTWAIGSGCVTFYNTSLDPNVVMERNFEENTFKIRAIKQINPGDELTHTYKSLKWRTCFGDIYNELSSNQDISN